MRAHLSAFLVNDFSMSSGVSCSPRTIPKKAQKSTSPYKRGTEDSALQYLRHPSRDTNTHAHALSGC